MIEFQDEVLNDDERFRVRDANENIIFDNCTFEMITPVSQSGTPINKVLFENIQAYIKSIDRYTTAVLNTNGEQQILNIDLKLDAYELNKVINIETPSNLNETLQTNYININNLGEVPINSRLRSNSKYTLIYNGFEFIVTPIEIDDTSKSVFLEITSSYGGTSTKNLEFFVGDASFVGISLWASNKYASSYTGIPSTAFILLDTKHNLTVFSIGNKRYKKYAYTNSASGELLQDTTTTPTQISASGNATTYLTSYTEIDTYARTSTINIYVSNITLENGILKIPASLYTNNSVGTEEATVYAVVNVIS